jgi:Conjugative transposon protein TcpC
MSDTWLTRTWQHRLTRSGGALRAAAKAIGFTACTIVALNIVWGWITDEPIDVAGPARATVNHTDYIKAYAENCISRLLTTTSDQRASLADCWTANDLQSLPTTVPVIVDYARANKVRLADSFPEAEQWQVVVEVSERPYASASPRTTYHQLSVLFSKYGLRATALPGSVNGGGGGATLPLAYPVSLPVGRPDGKGGIAPTSNPLSDTVSGFLTSYLTTAGGLERYVAAGSGLSPLADCASVQLTTLVATASIPDQTTPPDGTTVHVLATVNEMTAQYAPRPEQYPLALTVSSGRWTVTGIDAGPALVGGADLAPVAPAASAPLR